MEIINLKKPLFRLLLITIFLLYFSINPVKAQVQHQEKLLDSIYDGIGQPAQFIGADGFDNYINPFLDSLTSINEYTPMPINLHFTIDTFGRAINIKIETKFLLSSKDKSILENSLRQMPLWQPAMLNGRKLQQVFDIPFILCF